MAITSSLPERRRTLTAIMALSISLTSPAWAADPATASPKAKATQTPEQKAAELYEAGAKAARAGKWEQAREAFQEALRIKPHPVVAGRLGQAELQTGLYVDAANHLAWFLSEATGAGPEERQAAENMLAEAKANITAVTVRVDVPGAEVLVDGRPVGHSPLSGPVFLEPGPHRFEAQKKELGSAVQKVDASAGQILIYTGSALSGALALTGIATAIGAAATEQASLNDWHDHNCTSGSARCRNDFDEAEERRVLLSNTAVWTFIGAAVVGGATAAGALLTKPDSPTAPQTAVVVSPQGGVVTVTGRF